MEGKGAGAGPDGPDELRMKKSVEKIADEVKTDLRSIIRQFDKLRRPPKAIPVEKYGGIMYRFEGFENTEAARDEILTFVGTVYHVKESLHQYAKATNLTTLSAAGQVVRLKIEDEAEKSIAWHVIGDIWNYKKHKASQNRSKLNPVLHVWFKFEGTGQKAVYHNGATKDGDYLTSSPDGATRVADIHSPQGLVGDAVDVTVLAFTHLIPLIRQMTFLTAEKVDEAYIIGGLNRIEADAQTVTAKRNTIHLAEQVASSATPHGKGTTA